MKCWVLVLSSGLLSLALIACDSGRTSRYVVYAQPQTSPEVGPASPPTADLSTESFRQCADRENRQALEIVRATVGLSSSDQLVGIAELTYMACAERRGLAIREGLSADQAKEIVAENLRAQVEAAQANQGLNI